MPGEVWISHDPVSMQEIVRTTNGRHVPLDELEIYGVLPSMTVLTSMSANEFDQYYREIHYARTGEITHGITETFDVDTTGTTNTPQYPWHEILTTDTTHNILINDHLSDPVIPTYTNTIPSLECVDSIRIHSPIIDAVERSSGFNMDDIRDIIIEVLKSKGILNEDGEYHPQQIAISEESFMEFITKEESCCV